MLFQQGAASRRDANQEYPDLAVLLLAHAAAVLALHADAVCALLHEPRFVDHAHGADRPFVRRRHQFLRKYRLKLAVNTTDVPRRIGEETLQRQDLVLADAVLFGRAEDQSHRFGALAARSQEQTLEVDQRLRLRFLTAKQRSKALMKMQQLPSRSAQFVRSHGGILLREKNPPGLASTGTK